MLPEFLRYFHPYGYVLFAVYSGFSVLICLVAAKYVIASWKANSNRSQLAAAGASLDYRQLRKKSSLIDDLPYLLPEEPEAAVSAKVEQDSLV